MIINNKKEFEKFYPYDKKYIEEYPREYPCICKIEEEDRGIMGYEKIVYVAYYPKTLMPNDSFLEGLFYEWKPLK